MHHKIIGLHLKLFFIFEKNEKVMAPNGIFWPKTTPAQRHIENRKNSKNDDFHHFLLFFDGVACCGTFLLNLTPFLLKNRPFLKKGQFFIFFSDFFDQCGSKSENKEKYSFFTF